MAAVFSLSVLPKTDYAHAKRYKASEEFRLWLFSLINLAVKEKIEQFLETCLFTFWQELWSYCK